MCGICGIWNHNGKIVDKNLLLKMCRSFQYRGPDDEGTFSAPSIGLGHRRLSIIDLSPAGHQPMSNETGNIRLVFNGEIYNFSSLRADLESKGHQFKSDTDSETIIHLYEEEGTECLRHLNGMFAFAIWDGKNNRLMLARDRIGIKPLVYYWDGKKLAFGSEIKAILCDPDIPKEIDYEALDLYLTLNYIPAPWTIFKGIQKLAPGHCLILGDGEISIKTYWDIKSEKLYNISQNSIPVNFEDQKKGLRKVLEASAKRRLISDVPLGAFLSGGLDSSIIVSLMARHSDSPVKTFSIGYKDLPSFDETNYARDVARFNDTDHYEFKLGYRDILDVFPKVLENVDEPFADSSAVPTYIVSRETRNHVTVALSGDGGDELFAGYRMYFGEYWAKYYSMVPGIFKKGLVEPLINALPDSRDKPSLEKIRRAKKFLRGMSSSFPERFCGWREIFPYALRKNLLKTPPEKNRYLELVTNMAEAQKEQWGNDTINRMLYMDVKGLLHCDMLTKVDRMSMVNSLEVRVPFLDHNVVEYAFRLQGSTKLKATVGKHILLETFKPILPKSLYNRPKWGFEMPIGAWLRKELRFLVDEYLSEPVIKSQDFFNYDIIKKITEDHMNGRRDTSWHLWNLIVFQHWFKTYF